MTQEMTSYEAAEATIQARDNINEVASLMRVCAQALESLEVNDMSKLVSETITGCQLQLNNLETKLKDTEKLLSTIH